MVSEQQKRNIVIIGGGIIGSTTAYFLSHHENFNRERDSITLLEAVQIAGGASGKAGGLLALWAYPACIVPLSYRLHGELAEKHGGGERWGYRGVKCGQIEMVGRLSKVQAEAVSKGREEKQEGGNAAHVSLVKRTEEAKGLLRAKGVPVDLDWVHGEGVKAYEEMGTADTTAQVHPYLFTTSMAELAQEKGVKIVYGSAREIVQENGRVKGVTYTPKGSSTTSTPTAGNNDMEKTLQADTVILTAGPWTPTIHPSPISALRAHSITITPSRPLSAYALFTSITPPKTSTKKSRTTHAATPEIYARPNNEIYACGDGDGLVPLPATTADVAVDLARCQEVIDQVCSVSEELRDGTVTVRQACYLPNVEGGQGPLVGRTSVEGLLMGAGHTCWGVQNAPATAKCLAEEVWEGRVRSAEIKKLDPRRFGV